ncbi:biotin--[acetyl-CoA-carboxylase] ligase [Maricurvus nonylphenolicus]|uniref:biotin--[acetyl-CoA-carboxylase] ligase n=1 Tax=Maricurvus nonylphenolicus TaxID=1008307 RepID=UPI0036F1C31E
MDSQVRVPQGFRLFAFDEIDSTNTEAKRRADEGCVNKSVFWATTQSKGRGRKTRSWISDEGNLFVSVLVKDMAPAEKLANLSVIAAIAIGETIADLAPADCDIKYKWPNDVLINGRKVVGILLESGIYKESHWVVLGTGVNVSSNPPDSEIMYPAANLKRCGIDVEVADLLSHYLDKLDGYLAQWQTQGVAELIKIWRARMAGLGQRIHVQLTEDERVSGIFKELSDEGILILQTDSGQEQEVFSGDVFL